MLFFEFPEDARWNEDRDAVEFSVILRPYEGTVRIARRVFQGLLDQRPCGCAARTDNGRSRQYRVALG